eukprot:GHRR01035268.1.p1 GENE.GHRR01035268.1~~GHRR01035268.1.p1  ORF type:complete len:181 (+),score=49.48 GHRR01035268.1:123-665(+)
MMMPLIASYVFFSTTDSPVYSAAVAAVIAAAVAVQCRYGGFSYTEIMLMPLTAAMANALMANTLVWFALQGEMSAMVYHYPVEHMRLLPWAKQQILGNNQGWASNVRIGLSTNYNKLCGRETCTPGNVITAMYNLPAIQQLYNAVDFVGISCYPHYNGVLKDFEHNIQQYDSELQVCIGK